MKDFFVLNGNEKELFEFAQKNGIEPIFLYKPAEFSPRKDAGILLDTKNPNAISQTKADYVVVRYSDNIREVLERCKGIYVYGAEWGSREDFIHFRNSGMNHILAAIAAKKNITFLFSFKDYLQSNRKHILLGRLRQNMVLFRKYKVGFQVASFASNIYEVKKDFSAFVKMVEAN